LRDRWLQRSFGSGWPAMKQYYDFMLDKHFPANSTYAWGRAIELIDQADAMIDPALEPEAQLRLDDLKQYWYYYFLHDTGTVNPDAPGTRELAWKGQMSYMTAMHAVTTRVYAENDPAVVAGPAISSGPAHYTAAETAAWWDQVRAHWPPVVVDHFADATLADGTLASTIDLNDLTLVDEFVGAPPVAGRFLYNSNYQKQASFMTSVAAAGHPIGFTLIWPNYHNADAAYTPKDLRYTVEAWNPGTQSWEIAVDPSLTHQLSVETPSCPQYLEFDSCHVVAASVPAPSAGIFRITVGYGGNLAYLLPVAYDIAADTPTGRTAQTYTGLGAALTQAPSYFYIPKGTSSLDLDVWDDADSKTLTIYTGLMTQDPDAPHREVDITGRGTHRIALQPGEDGTIAILSQNGFAFPYLHAVPQLWAMSPDELMVPRAITTADGLTASAR